MKKIGVLIGLFLISIFAISLISACTENLGIFDGTESECYQACLDWQNSRTDGLCLYPGEGGYQYNDYLYGLHICKCDYFCGNEGMNNVRYYKDADRDGYYPSGGISWEGSRARDYCLFNPLLGWSTTVKLSGDCDDTLTQVNPGETEICENGFDDDCVGGDAPCPASCTTGNWQNTNDYRCENDVSQRKQTRTVSPSGCAA